MAPATRPRFDTLILVLVASILICLTSPPAVALLSKDEAAKRVEPPYQLGSSIGKGGWELVNLDGRLAGYAFESEPLAPLPGFSGAPINLFVQITLEGKFINVEIISHNEPIFVSGLGNAAFHKFVRQYKGHSVNDTLVVGIPYGDKDQGTSLIYLEGVTKATASVRIAHESVLAAAFAIARERLAGVGRRVPVSPKPRSSAKLTWNDLVERGIARRRLVTNAELQAAFKDTLWEDDDPIAADNPDAAYLDLWVVDVGPGDIARAVLAPETFAALREFMSISTHDEPLLVIDAGRHGLVSEEFVRNTSPDLISASQDGLPIALRDADLEVELADGVPGKVAMILRTDRRLGFDPTREWTISLRAIRKHGSFRPEIGTVDFSLSHSTPLTFFDRQVAPEPVPPWRQAIADRWPDLALLALILTVLVAVLTFRMEWLAAASGFLWIRLASLAVVIGFVGWWGQGQLSVVTPIGIARAVYEGKSLVFLLYDPFSLLIWIVALLSFVYWGRGLFCGWLCPFGAMQEFAHYVGRLMRLPEIRLPARVDGMLVNAKYVVLAALFVTAFTLPATHDTMVEVEPFKTAITTYFVREWHYVLYAVALLVLSMVLFKGFCRYLCPLGAFMAIGGLLRQKDWIERRDECGTPCQLCRVKCNYRAIRTDGTIRYDECFQCLDCVSIYEDPKRCVPLVLAARKEARS